MDNGIQIYSSTRTDASYVWLDLIATAIVSELPVIDFRMNV